MSADVCSSCPSHSSVPLRSSWARAVLTKIEHDRCLQTIDRSQWYRLSNSDLLQDRYRRVFHEFDDDEQTRDFLQRSTTNSDNVLVQIIQSLLTSLLTLFMTRTSANGLLGRGRMFVYSTPQFRTLLDLDARKPSPLTSLLDIGAGDGSVTERMAGLFEQVYVTEMSPTMRWRLGSKGYSVLDTDQWGNSTFDVITCLNVLDRCEKPLSLLTKLRDHLNPQQGRLIISLVLPLKQYFEYTNHHRPNESIAIDGSLPEEQIHSLVTSIFQPLGFHLRKLTRLPYLCEGDIERSYYFLSDYLFVLELS